MRQQNISAEHNTATHGIETPGAETPRDQITELQDNCFWVNFVQQCYNLQHDVSGNKYTVISIEMHLIILVLCNMFSSFLNSTV
jgi:hypothetical protein